MPMIQVDNLTKQYGDTNVLKGVNLTIHEGEVYGFVGHNGAGKSTFIHTLTGIINKSSGSFEMLGTPDSQLDKIKQDIGVMPDVANLYHHMRGLNFLKYMGSLVGDTRSKDEYKELLNTVGLDSDAGNKKIKSYSFGMKKKLSIAQALLGDPQLLILDEPTSGLDPQSAIDIRKMITGLQEQGKTIFLTSHNLDEIEKVSDRVGILSDGLIKKSGVPKDLKVHEDEGQRLIVRTKPQLTDEYLQIMGMDVTLVDAQKGYTLIDVKADEDIPRLSQAIIETGLSLYEISIQERSLEDVFMNV